LKSPFHYDSNLVLCLQECQVNVPLLYPYVAILRCRWAQSIHDQIWNQCLFQGTVLLKNLRKI